MQSRACAITRLRPLAAQNVASAVAVDAATGTRRLVAHPDERRAHTGAEAVDRVARGVDLTTSVLRAPSEERGSDGGTYERHEPKHEKNPTCPVSG